jgi:hypothetical protein
VESCRVVWHGNPTQPQVNNCILRNGKCSAVKDKECLWKDSILALLRPDPSDDRRRSDRDKAGLLRTPQPSTIVKYRQMRQAGLQGACLGVAFWLAPLSCALCLPSPSLRRRITVTLGFCTFAPLLHYSTPPARRGGLLQDQPSPAQSAHTWPILISQFQTCR